LNAVAARDRSAVARMSAPVPPERSAETCENRRMTPRPSALAESIDALLPQTQCTRCGYPACRAYAQAIADEGAEINQCPPGGQAGIDRLAELLGRTRLPLNPANGTEKPREVALIDETACIGCTKCIQACPVDAIVGASKRMHTVIADECSGCELCLAPCPVDCITMVAAGDAGAPIDARAALHRARYDARNARLERERRERLAELETKKAAIGGGAVQAAIARARARAAALKDAAR
jgi:electron transport complex protein RnfB